MKPSATLVLALLVAGWAHAGDVYATRDAQGNIVYTDTPRTLPAEKLDIHSSSTDPAQVQQRYSAEMKEYSADAAASSKAVQQQADLAKAQELSAEDKAKQCAEARTRYQRYMDSWRLYEPGPDGERRYLDSDEIDEARAKAKQVMDDLCSGQ
jgi:hypothetical protein